MTPLDEILPPPFPGFSDEGLAFLDALRDHNDRDWFKARKATYDAHLKAPLDLLVEGATRALAAAGSDFTAGRSMRIYRDIRFSKDKRPYRTHVSASFRRPEVESPIHAYVHVEPGASFVAVGAYRPSVAYLRPVRRRVAERWEAFEAMRAEVEAAGLALTSAGTELTGMPRGFAAHRDGPAADVLRWESLLAERPLADADVRSPALVDRVVEVVEGARPLVRFLDEAHSG